MTLIKTFIEEQIFTAAFLANLISGFITSFVFLFCLLFFFRPRIKLSNSIATHIDQLDNQTPKRPCWVFKVVNKSFFSAFDLKVEVSQKLPIYGPNGGQNFRTKPIRLLRDQFGHVAPFCYKWQNARTDYALWFLTYENISDLLASNPQSTIEIRIECKHSLTGLGSVWVTDFTLSDINTGTFKSGNNFEVV